MHRSRRRLLGASLVAALLAQAGAPAAAQEPATEPAPAAAADTADDPATSWDQTIADPALDGADEPTPADPAREPYQYPSGPSEPTPYPTGWVRVPATAADLLLVRPAMVAGLGAGAVAFVVTLPFTIPLRTTDDAAHALVGQTWDALARPLGTF